MCENPTPENAQPTARFAGPGGYYEEKRIKAEAVSRVLDDLVRRINRERESGALFGLSEARRIVERHLEQHRYVGD